MPMLMLFLYDALFWGSNSLYPFLVPRLQNSSIWKVTPEAIKQIRRDVIPFLMKQIEDLEVKICSSGPSVN